MTTVDASTGTDINDPVRGADRVFIVLYNNKCITEVT